MDQVQIEETNQLFEMTILVDWLQHIARPYNNGAVESVAPVFGLRPEWFV